MRNPRLLLALVALTTAAGVRTAAPSASLTADRNFRPPVLAEPATPARMLLLPDGKYVVYSNPDTLVGQRAGAMTRYLPSGTLDTSFHFSRAYESVGAAIILPSGKLLVAATQWIYGEAGSERILLLNGDGSIDLAFNAPPVSATPTRSVRTFALQPDGKILVAGFFDTFGGQPLQKIVRLLPDGTLDSSFTPPSFTPPPDQFSGQGLWAKPAILADGRILIAGDFRYVNGVLRRGIARLNSDGSADETFVAAAFSRATPTTGLVVQADGKIVMAGRFIAPLSSAKVPLVRLNSDGSVDSSFSLAFNFSFEPPTVNDIAAQPDGRMVAACATSLYRFQVNGALDTSFRQPSLVDASIDPSGYPGKAYSVGLLPDGRVLFAGNFTDVDPPGAPQRAQFGVARVTATGGLDATLAPTHEQA